MTGPVTLAQLAECHGIQSAYEDPEGRIQVCPDSTRRALLAAMGLATDNQADLDAAMAALEADQVRRVLPPALVVREGEPILLPAWLPAPAAPSAGPEGLRWRLRLEDGATRDGTFPPPAEPNGGSGASRSAGTPDGPGAQPAAAPDPETTRRLDGTDYHLRQLRLPTTPGLGYHTLEVDAPAGRVTLRLIVTPERCHQPPALARGERLWGLAVQLYAVRSRRNWGLGDFTDLRRLVTFTQAAGGALVGINPLHALFPGEPGRATPYSPSSRCHVDERYLDLEAMADFAEDAEVRQTVRAPVFQAALATLRLAPCVDYPAVAALKAPLLERLYRHFRAAHQLRGSARGLAFAAYRRDRGRALRGLTLFRALQEAFQHDHPGQHGWQAWPVPFRDPGSPQVARFASAHAERLDFWAYLQWQAELQLGAAAAQARRLGLAVGLYGDLAVGVDGGGADTWLHPDRYALGASVGSPPDAFCPDGQDWGLPPMLPGRLRETGFQAFIDLLQANMRHCGALRLDHVMGLTRLFWVPGGGQPAQGAYVAYPFPELLGILALESQRHQCLVVGEDLGTVPPDLRATLRQAGVLSCHPMCFERDGAGFRPPGAYPAQALASFGTHDTATLAGTWQGHDLEVRQALGFIPSAEQRDQAEAARARDRDRLLAALEAEGLLRPAPRNPAHEPRAPAAQPPPMPPQLVQAVLAFLARSPAGLLEVQPEDVLGQLDQVNLPGSLDDQHPNWCRKLTLDLEAWATDPRFRALVRTMDRAGRRQGSAPGAAPGLTSPTPEPAAARIPRATYRLQFSRDFSLAQATDLVPYLQALGISHCYASPLLRARPGSPHGYDIIDHGALNPEIGTPGDLARFVRALHDHHMGLILDFVPNHMAVLGSDNAWWQDVLENGQASPFAPFFDIDWRPLREDLHGKVLLPVLANPYGQELERGAITLGFQGPRGEFRLSHGPHGFPVDPGAYPLILAAGREWLAQRLDPAAPERLELESLMTAFGHLPGRDSAGPEAAAERVRDQALLKRRLAALWARSLAVRRCVGAALRAFHGTVGQPRSFDPLHRLIQAQAYRLACWKVAADEINYRRFFDINDLAGIRMELEPVFEATHALLFQWLQLGYVDGLRLDHPDGLHDPLAYFQRLQRRAAELRGTEPEPRPLYLVVEKILARHEHLPATWPVHGETGYRFANQLNGLFVDGAAEARMDAIYTGFTGRTTPLADLHFQCKTLIIHTALASEMSALANALARIAQADRQTCDFTLRDLREALSEVVACFPVYRTYLDPEGCSDQDRRCLAWAVAAARQRAPETGAQLFDFLAEVLGGRVGQDPATGAVLGGRVGQDPATGLARQVTAWAMKFQQYSAPVMAKGLEDTCFYRYNRLVALNDVGGDPGSFGTSVAAFHHANRLRRRDWPHGMLASSTHDSKHSEDFRLRVDGLSEMPAAWQRALDRWSRMNRGKRTRGADGRPAPSANDEFRLYQALLGAWPLQPMDAAAMAAFRIRIQAYLLKAAREAKERTSWNHPDAAYEAGLAKFVTAILGGPAGTPFRSNLQAAVASLARPALLSGLSLALVKSTAPGVPDFYQGHELPVFSLVDPDNRRPVDYPLRQRLLDELRAQAPGPDLARALLAGLEDGRAKLFVTWRALDCRRRHPELFRDGDYLPLRAEGARAGHICAFARRYHGQLAVTVAPRLFQKLRMECGGELGSIWQADRLEVPGRGSYVDALTGAAHTAQRANGKFWLPLAAVLAHFPVALLIRTPAVPPAEAV